MSTDKRYFFKHHSTYDNLKKYLWKMQKNNHCKSFILSYSVSLDFVARPLSSRNKPKWPPTLFFYQTGSLNILVRMLIDATNTLTLQHQKNTVRKQSIQISHESIIREYSNIENAILNANLMTFICINGRFYHLNLLFIDYR